jgi:hypothetical protein
MREMPHVADQGHSSVHLSGTTTTSCTSLLISRLVAVVRLNTHTTGFSVPALEGYRQTEMYLTDVNLRLVCLYCNKIKNARYGSSQNWVDSDLVGSVRGASMT